MPGAEGSVGPFPGQYSRPHVYARDVHSGVGNCVCGRHLQHRLHTEVAPGVPISGQEGRRYATRHELAHMVASALARVHGPGPWVSVTCVQLVMTELVRLGVRVDDVVRVDQ